MLQQFRVSAPAFALRVAYAPAPAGTSNGNMGGGVPWVKLCKHRSAGGDEYLPAPLLCCRILGCLRLLYPADCIYACTYTQTGTDEWQRFDNNTRELKVIALVLRLQVEGYVYAGTCAQQQTCCRHAQRCMICNCTADTANTRTMHSMTHPSIATHLTPCGSTDA